MDYKTNKFSGEMPKNPVIGAEMTNLTSWQRIAEAHELPAAALVLAAKSLGQLLGDSWESLLYDHRATYNAVVDDEADVQAAGRKIAVEFWIGGEKSLKHFVVLNIAVLEGKVGRRQFKIRSGAIYVMALTTDPVAELRNATGRLNHIPDQLWVISDPRSIRARVILD